MKLSTGIETKERKRKGVTRIEVYDKQDLKRFKKRKELINDIKLNLLVFLVAAFFVWLSVNIANSQF